MNPQYAPQYGLPPNPYGFPNQGMPQPGPPKPQQSPNQQFAPPPGGQNSFPGYGGPPNQNSAPPPQMNAPANNAHNPAMQAPSPSSNFPSQPTSQNSNFPQKPGGNPPMAGPPTSQNFSGMNPISPHQAPQMPQPNANVPSQSGQQGLPSQPPHSMQPNQAGHGLPAMSNQQTGPPGQPSQHQGGQPGQTPLSGQPPQGGNQPGHPPQVSGQPGQPPLGGSQPGHPQQGGGLPGHPPQGGSQPPQQGGGQPGQHPHAGGQPAQAPRPLGALPGQPPPSSTPSQPPQNSMPSQQPPTGFQGQPPSGFPGQPPQSGFPGQPRPPQQGAPTHQPFQQGPPQNLGQQYSPNQPMPPQNFPPMQKPGYPGAPPTMSGPPPSAVPPQGPPPGSGFYPPQQQRTPMPPRPGTTFPNPANPDNLSGQMAGMNLNGPLPPMGPNQHMNMNGPSMNQPGMQMPGQRYPNINGGPGPQMNGIPDPNAPRPPMQQRYPQDNQHIQGGYPPMTSPPGEYPPASGVPPPFPAAQPSYPNQPYQQQQQRRLDPDAMPSPVQVVMEDQQTKSGIFYTNQKGQLPPLVTTDFITVDQGNASPRFMRSTMYNVPVTADMMKQTAVPFALVISPMAELLEEEHPPPLVDFGELGPVRCIRCKAYMCPNMQFFDGGRRFLCLLCKASTEVPAEYFQHLDHTGLRTDRYERAELMLGTYDIVATKEYCRDSVPPKPPALIFVIDVSYNNVKSGLVHLLCSQMKSFLFNLPKERGQEKSSLRVGFITYNSSVHFYNVNPNLAQPQMLVVGDVQEMFMPLLDGFLADVDQSEALIDMLMEQIPTMFGDTRETETVLAPAIQAGLEALKAAGCAGKLLVFHSSLPTFEAPGKLKNRDERKLLGTEKEKTVLTPQNKVYNDLGQDCVQSGCSVDLYVFNNSFIDLATIGQVARLTGGEIYKYTYFQADLDGDRVVSDVRANVKRLCAFDAIMRVRTSAGVRPTDFYGHFFMSNTTDIELAAVDPDKAVAVEIKHDDKLSEEDGVYIQAALLYTSLCGQRRIRVLNLALKACAQMTELYRTCELDTLMNFFTKQAVYKLMDATPKSIRENYIQRSAQILACYRKNCASPTSAGQLILPECMKLLPLYMNCMLKNDAISGGSDMTVDDRWFVMAAVTTMDVPTSANYLYPRLVSLADMGDDMPVPIRCSSEKMSDGGVYLLENGIYMFLWLGLAVPPEWVNQVFGVPSSSQVDTDKNRLPVLDNPLSEKIREIISLVGSSRHRSMRLTIVRQRDKMELVMKHFLVEDKGLDGSASYVDFLCHLHKEIRAIIS